MEQRGIDVRQNNHGRMQFKKDMVPIDLTKEMSEHGWMEERIRVANPMSLR